MENTMEQPKKERIFISYKRVDKDRVFEIIESIEQTTGEKCWIDLDGIESNAQFVAKIVGAIDECDIFLFMRSKVHNNITNLETDWTIREVNYALEEHKNIVIVNLDNTPMPKWFRFMFPNKQEIDATDPDKLNRLNFDLCRWLGVTPKEVVESEEKTQPEPPRTESSQPQESTTPTDALDSKRKINSPSTPTPKKKEKKSQDKVVTTTKKVDGKQTAKKAAIAAGVVAGTLLFPAGAAIVGTAVGAKKLWDKYKKKK